MSILDVVKDVCAATGVAIPSTVFSGVTSNRTMAEMMSLANEMAQRIAYDMREWGALKKTTTFVGDGVISPPDSGIWVGTAAFNLPADFNRMLLTSEVWRSSDTIGPMRFISDTNEWMRRRMDSDYESRGEWMIMGGKMHIHPIMPVGTSATFTYLNKNCVDLRAPDGSQNGYGDRFMSDLDRYVLSERVLKLGMIWQWKAQKGSPYAEDMGTYGDALNTEAGADTPAPIFVGRLPLSSNERIAYPWPVYP
jgi:hypothetical protein